MVFGKILNEGEQLELMSKSLLLLRVSGSIENVLTGQKEISDGEIHRLRRTCSLLNEIKYGFPFTETRFDYLDSQGQGLRTTLEGALYCKYAFEVWNNMGIRIKSEQDFLDKVHLYESVLCSVIEGQLIEAQNLKDTKTFLDNYGDYLRKLV